ncbi:YL1 nuclear [Syncephalis fuscata]|nr:YL1 nuclear [Syncephalis fuscata]
MRELLDKEHERMMQREAAGTVDDDGAEADDEDFAEPVEDGDVFDSDFEQEENEETTEGTNALDTDAQLFEEEREEERRRKKKVHVPAWNIPQKAVTINKRTTTTSTKTTLTSKTTSTQPLPPPRHSLRTQAIINKHQVEERLRQEELRRSIFPKKEKAEPVIISQAERLLEAKQTERENIAQLEKHLKLEEQEQQKRKNIWATKRYKYPFILIIKY